MLFWQGGRGRSGFGGILVLLLIVVWSWRFLCGVLSGCSRPVMVSMCFEHFRSCSVALWCLLFGITVRLTKATFSKAFIQPTAKEIPMEPGSSRAKCGDRRGLRPGEMPEDFMSASGRLLVMFSALDRFFGGFWIFFFGCVVSTGYHIQLFFRAQSTWDYLSIAWTHQPPFRSTNHLLLYSWKTHRKPPKTKTTQEKLPKAPRKKTKKKLAVYKSAAGGLKTSGHSANSDCAFRVLTSARRRRNSMPNPNLHRRGSKDLSAAAPEEHRRMRLPKKKIPKLAFSKRDLWHEKRKELMLHTL